MRNKTNKILPVGVGLSVFPFVLIRSLLIRCRRSKSTCSVQSSEQYHDEKAVSCVDGGNPPPSVQFSMGI
jgi:hypothetical protein